MLPEGKAAPVAYQALMMHVLMSPWASFHSQDLESKLISRPTNHQLAGQLRLDVPKAPQTLHVQN